MMPARMNGLSILGSTGSVGTNVLRIVDAFPDRFRVVGLAAGSNVERLAEQVARYRPRVVSVATAAAREALSRLGRPAGACAWASARRARWRSPPTPRRAWWWPRRWARSASCPPTAPWRRGKDVALANKETLVMAGELMVAQARAKGGRLLPIDSEHCALHQCLDGRKPEEVRRLVLTASGGPFRTRPRDTFATRHARGGAEASPPGTWAARSPSTPPPS